MTKFDKMEGRETLGLKKDISGGDAREEGVRLTGYESDTRKWASLSKAERLQILKKFQTVASYPGTTTDSPEEHEG